jgi:membrane protease YdiL (CAAX protease family)
VAIAVQPARLFDDSFLKFFPATMREPRRAWLAILTGWALSIVGSIVLAALSRAIAPTLPAPEFPMKGPMAFFMLVVFAPFVETLIMAGLLSLLLRFLPPATSVLLSALAWGVAHSSMALGWGLVIWWPFLIFSTLYVVWRQRGFWVAVGIAATTHALQNLAPGLVVAFS